MRKLILLALLVLPALASAVPLGVFVSVLPQKTFVEKIGGEHVNVRVMVGQGHNPVTYDPTPRQIEALAETTLYVRTGVPFENVWMERIQSVNPQMRVLDARTGIDLRAIEHHEHEHEHDDVHDQHQHHHDKEHTVRQTNDQVEHDQSKDPHVWTSPPLVKRMAGNIRDILIELDPANGQDYARNYEAFAAELDMLDRDIRILLDDLPHRKFMVFHPAWGYFADTYGLTQIPIEKGGKEPGARMLTTLIRQAKREQVRVIFVQPQFGKKSAEQVARAIGGNAVPADPLAVDYVNNLRNVARLIAEAAQP